jgi:hypothetical protein
VCAGIPALHFFASGQKPFTPPVMESTHGISDDRFILPARIEEDISREVNQDEDYIALDEPTEKILPSPAAETADITLTSSGTFRETGRSRCGAKLQLVRHGNAHVRARG